MITVLVKQWRVCIRMNKESAIAKFEAPSKVNHWEEEDHIDLITPQKATMHISRIIYAGDNADESNPKRCLSLTKNGKSVAFDIEMAIAVAAAVQKLGEEFVPAELR